MEPGTNPVLEKSFDFALLIIEFAELLEEGRKYVIARQLLKSGTSMGANIREAQSSESLLDFIHKMKIAAKEADETEYWLLLCMQSKNYPNPIGLLEKNSELIKLLSSIITSSKTKLSARNAK